VTSNFRSKLLRASGHTIDSTLRQGENRVTQRGNGVTQRGNGVTQRGNGVNRRRNRVISHLNRSLSKTSRTAGGKGRIGIRITYAYKRKYKGGALGCFCSAGGLGDTDVWYTHTYSASPRGTRGPAGRSQRVLHGPLALQPNNGVDRR
jgi:hypothetical protein